MANKKIVVIKKKNGCQLLKYPSGSFGIEYSNACVGYGMKYTDNEKEAIKFFKKVSKDTSDKSISAIKKQNKNYKQKVFTIIHW